ncbi:hypothetical protein GLOIN_2v1877815 [Rhizophagus clarus]|uniref:Uncharacterized protein n=1 Tax=Rhizophagus clarus TaxID=94130 RepID=A0A8H3MC69_9GLOM|nr:hypothetical protein GLOIN_2v1877815 [Rhizophagus clarus]
MQKIYNNYKSGFNQFNQLQDNDDNENIINKRNYNIDFLLIALRDTLHSLRDDDTWFQEIIRRSKELLKTIFSFELPKTGVAPYSQSKFDEISIKLVKVLKNTGKFINDLTGNEPLALPYTLWLGILDLIQNLIQNSI